MRNPFFQLEWLPDIWLDAARPHAHTDKQGQSMYVDPKEAESDTRARGVATQNLRNDMCCQASLHGTDSLWPFRQCEILLAFYHGIFHVFRLGRQMSIEGAAGLSGYAITWHGKKVGGFPFTLVKKATHRHGQSGERMQPKSTWPPHSHTVSTWTQISPAHTHTCAFENESWTPSEF